MVDSSGSFEIEFNPESLFIDENGFLFHDGPEQTGGVALVKSPGLAEDIYSQLNFDSNGALLTYNDIIIRNSETIARIDFLKKHNLFGSHIEPDL